MVLVALSLALFPLVYFPYIYLLGVLFLFLFATSKSPDSTPFGNASAELRPIDISTPLVPGQDHS